MAVVVLALLSGAAFGLVAVFMRMGLGRIPDPALGALHTTAVGFLTSATVAVAITQGGDISLAGVWPFFVLGLAVPGLTHVMVAHAVQGIGASRTMVILGAPPLLSSFAAIVFLDEALRAPLAIGTVLIVVSAFAVAWDRARPEHYRAVGVVWAVGSIVLFAARDTISRWVVVDRDVPGVAAATALLAGATVAVVLFVLVTRYRSSPLAQMRASLAPFIGAGVAFGVAHLALLEAIDRGKITVVSPLLGTVAIWTVLFAAILLRQSEAISRRLLAAALLVVAGAAVIGVAR